MAPAPGPADSPDKESSLFMGGAESQGLLQQPPAEESDVAQRQASAQLDKILGKVESRGDDDTKSVRSKLSKMKTKDF